MKILVLNYVLFVLYVRYHNCTLSVIVYVKQGKQFSFIPSDPSLKTVSPSPTSGLSDPGPSAAASEYYYNYYY